MLNTIFTIKSSKGTKIDDVEVSGSGQETCSLALKTYQDFKVILKGFINPNNKQFIPVNLKPVSYGKY